MANVGTEGLKTKGVIVAVGSVSSGVRVVSRSGGGAHAGTPVVYDYQGPLAFEGQLDEVVVELEH